MGVGEQLLTEAAANIAERAAAQALDVWPENWHAVLAFLEMGSQWRVIPTMTSLLWQGLEYAAIPLVLAALKPRVPAECRRPLHELMPQLRTLERRAVELKNA